MPLLQFLLLVLLFSSSLAKRKKRHRPPSIVLDSPNGNATTSTTIAFTVRNKRLSTSIKVHFLLNGNLIKAFDSTYFHNRNKRLISMDISNIPRQNKHNVSVILLNAKTNKVYQTVTKETWFVDDYKTLLHQQFTCPNNTCQRPNNNFAAPFYASVLNVFSALELENIRNLTRSKRDLYTDTTVGEIESVNNNYRRTKKLIAANTPGLMHTIYTTLENVARTLNEKYWRFHISALNTTCRSHESLQFLLYNSNNQGFYDWHMDRGISGSSSKRKLSMTVQLTDSNEYTGGALEIMTGRDHVSMPRQAGIVSVFPSYMLHRVSPVLSGSREAIVLWFTGCEGYT